MYEALESGDLHLRDLPFHEASQSLVPATPQLRGVPCDIPGKDPPTVAISLEAAPVQKKDVSLTKSPPVGQFTSPPGLDHPGGKVLLEASPCALVPPGRYVSSPHLYEKPTFETCINTDGVGSQVLLKIAAEPSAGVSPPGPTLNVGAGLDAPQKERGLPAEVEYLLPGPAPPRNAVELDPRAGPIPALVRVQGPSPSLDADHRIHAIPNSISCYDVPDNLMQPHHVKKCS